MFNEMPSEVSIEITHACPNKCIMCSSNACNPSPIKNELTTLRIKEIIRDSYIMNVKDISLSGGEPFLHPDILIIYKNIAMYYMRPVIYTAGVTIENEVLIPITETRTFSLIKETFRETGAKMIFDVQGHTAQLHNKIMAEDIFDLEMEAIKECVRLWIPTETHVVPQKENYYYLEEILSYSLQELGVDKVSLLRLVGQGRAVENDCYITKQQFGDLQHMFCLWDTQKEFNKDGKRIRYGHPIDWRALVNPEKYTKPTCRGGVDAPLIQPDGFVDVCPAWKDLKIYNAGNVRTKSLTDIWRYSDNYNIFRNFVHKEGWKVIDECKDCKHFETCRGGCVAQRLLEVVKTDCLPLDKAIEIDRDPLCFIDEL